MEMTRQLLMAQRGHPEMITISHYRFLAANDHPATSSNSLCM